MSLLGDMFDPVGVFGGDKGDIVNNLLDPVGGFMQTWDIGQGSDYGDLHNGIGNWMDDLGDSNSIMAQNRWKNFRKDDGLKRMLQTGDLYASGSPWGTKLNNEIWHTDNKPLWDTLGDTTSADQQEVENRGQDLSAYGGLRTVGTGIGKGFINAFTYGAGSTAIDAMDAWGNDQDYEKVLKNGAKNYAINYAANGALDGAGEAIGNTGGYTEAGGGYVGNNEYGGTGSFSLGKTLGAGEYTPVVNSVAKGAVGGAIGAAGQGGNSSDIGKGAATGATMQGVKQGAGMLGDYFKNYGNDEMPDVGTLGGTMQDNNGENSATLGGETTPTQQYANLSMPSRERSMSIQSSQEGSQDSPVNAFLQSMGVSVGGGKGLGNIGDMAGSLFGMYNANKQKKKLQEQQSQLQSLFSPNSPYAQQMRQRVERKDAAAGRRSQYGPREAQLAAILADRQAQTMPQQQTYANAIGGYDNAMVNNLLKGSGSLMNMYRPGQASAPVMGSTRGYDPYSNPMYFGGGEGE